MIRNSETSEWRRHWTMVAAAMMGLSFVTISIYSIGLFMEPLSREFGWTRTEVTTGLSISTLLSIPLSPFIGAMLDRWGSRRLAIPGVVLSAFAFAALSLTNGSVVLWVGLWMIYGFVGLAIVPMVWTKAVSSVFFAGRGLALAVALSGFAVSQMLVPPITQWLIDGYGWRRAFLWMGLGWGGIVLVLIFPFFLDSRDQSRQQPDPSSRVISPPNLSGITVREALRNPVLLKVAAATFITSLMTVAITVHKVPILTGLGISREAAAYIAASAGVVGICGKLFTGWLLDRSKNSGWIAGISMSLPAIACFLLIQPLHNVASVGGAMILLGYSAGAYVHLCTYLTSRYGGVRNFGKIFGFMASLMGIGGSIGPIAAGMAYDRFGNYNDLLASGILAALVSGLLVARLGPYPNWGAAETTPSEAPLDMVVSN